MKLDFPGTPGWFNYRAAGLLIDHNRVLLHHHRRDHWAIPGGHIDPFETAAQTLIREYEEELGITVTVGRAVWVSQHFFTYKGKPVHEMCWYYLLDLPANHPLRAREGEFDGLEKNGLHFAWCSLDQLDALVLYPTWLTDRLGNLPDQLEVVVSDERG